MQDSTLPPRTNAMGPDRWMDALRHHRFDLSRHSEYDCLVECMEEADNRLTNMTAEANAHTGFARSLFRKGLEYLSKLHCEGSARDDISFEDQSSQQDLQATLVSISVLLDKLFAHADNHRRVAELRRRREEELLDTRGRLEQCEADLKAQTSHVHLLQREIETLRQARQSLRCEYETRYSELNTREHELQMRERELLLHVEERERVSELRFLEADKKTAEWVAMLETTTSHGDSTPGDLLLPTPQSIFDRVKACEEPPEDDTLPAAVSTSSSAVVEEAIDSVDALTPDPGKASSPDVGCGNDPPSPTVEKLSCGSSLPHHVDTESCNDCPSEASPLEYPVVVGSVVDVTDSTPRSEGAASVRLPLGWTCKESKSYKGKLYYFNVISGETRWEPPLQAHAQRCSPSKLVVSDAASQQDGGHRASDEWRSLDQLRRSLDVTIGRGMALSASINRASPTSGHRWAEDADASTRHSEDGSSKRSSAWKAKLIRKVAFAKASRPRSSTPPTTPRVIALASTPTDVQRHAF